ncbi:hypothetical protein Misp06_01367 [Microbulbifer sp. NBRC 101763]|uniref:hypothetical protein n=1 Tax=Microbulbifer TaxID=48073 RepID=UPI00036B0BC2|nr:MULTISPECIES: hypothetical protein [Microbulbifer]WHI51711.1 hypothetical protein P3339_02440 [Microbulbifer sp. MLAF003]
MLRVLTLITGITLAVFAQAEEVVTGTLEEIISEDFETGKVERRFSLKDEQSGHYYFIEAEELKRKGMKTGDRVKIRGERGKKRMLHIKETQKLETEGEE